MCESGICQMCLKSDFLQRSHIIPRAYWRKLLNGGGQGVHIRPLEQVRPKKKNSSPNEYLLCRSCEELISNKYERRSIDYLRKYSNENNKIIFLRFNFKEIYLYYISIIFKASLSKLELFNSIDMKEIHYIFRYCLLNNSVNYEKTDITKLIKISLVKLTDNKEILGKSVIDNVYINFYHDVTEKFIATSFCMDGFLITYRIGIFNEYDSYIGEITKRKFQVIPKIEFYEIEKIRNSFINTSQIVSKFPGTP